MHRRNLIADACRRALQLGGRRLDSRKRTRLLRALAPQRLDRLLHLCHSLLLLAGRLDVDFPLNQCCQLAHLCLDTLEL